MEENKTCYDCNNLVSHHKHLLCDDCWDEIFNKSDNIDLKKEPMIPLSKAFEFAELASKWSWSSRTKKWGNVFTTQELWNKFIQENQK